MYSRRGLIQEQNWWVAQQFQGDSQSFSLAARQSRRHGVVMWIQTQKIQQFNNLQNKTVTYSKVCIDIGRALRHCRTDNTRSVQSVS